MALSTDQSDALAAWRAALPDDAVSVDAETVDRYARSTLPNATRPCCVLFPANTEQVQRVVEIASRCGVVVYPLSCGKNWGYGDACAAQDGAAIVDLSRMNGIIEVDPELGYAVIEPGVTQQQLYEHVRSAAPAFWVDCTGAGTDASIVGNVLERGFGHTPYGDHVRSTCGMEIVLADGRILETGLGHFPEAKARHLYPYGVGPSLDGLFVQSNLGIVTRMGVWLYPKPDAFQFFFVRVEASEALDKLVDTLRPLRMDGTLNSAVHIGNDLRIISALQTYPWEAAEGEVPLPSALRAELRRENGVGAWNVSGALTGSRAQVRAAAAALRKATRSFAKVTFVDDRKLAFAQWAVRHLKKVGMGSRLSRKLEALVPNYGLLKGIPTNTPLLGTQWRLRTPSGCATDDPLETGSGLLWISPILPMRGEDAARVLEMVTRHFAEHGFDVLVTFTLINERSMVGVFNIAYDKGVSEECEAASSCYHTLMRDLIAAGYPPYRVNALSMDALCTSGDTFWEVSDAIKRALDAKDVIARGRYIPPLGG